MPASWFQYPLVTVGNVIQLEKKQWTVLRQYGERDAQASSDDPPSFVSTKLKCQSGNITAYMRIFMQVPFIGTESTPPHERAKQATTFNPRELQALSRLTTKGSRFAPRLLDTSIQTQDSVNGLVPGGALVFLVWEIVPGVRLGDTLGSDVFWALSPDERNRIRAALVRGYEELTANGYMPFPGSTENLVWDSATGRLSFIGFRDCMCVPEPRKWRPELYPSYGVAKAPRHCRYSSSKWDGDTSDWVW